MISIANLGNAIRKYLTFKNIIFWIFVVFCLLFPIFQYNKNWTYGLVFLPFGFAILGWGVWAFFNMIIRRGDYKKNHYRILLNLLLANTLGLSILEFIRFELKGFSWFSITWGKPDVFLAIFIVSVFVIVILDYYLLNEKIEEEDIFEGIKYSTYPATLAGIALFFVATFYEEMFKKKAEYALFAVGLFIISSMSMLVYKWYVSIKEEDKDESLLKLLRIFSIGFFFGGLLSLLVLVLPITVP